MPKVKVIYWLLSKVIKLSTVSNIFYSETFWLIEAKFHVESPWNGETKLCSNDFSDTIEVLLIIVIELVHEDL